MQLSKKIPTAVFNRFLGRDEEVISLNEVSMESEQSTMKITKKLGNIKPNIDYT
jgi:hypothetical protein